MNSSLSYIVYQVPGKRYAYRFDFVGLTQAFHPSTVQTPFASNHINTNNEINNNNTLNSNENLQTSLKEKKPPTLKDFGNNKKILTKTKGKNVISNDNNNEINSNKYNKEKGSSDMEAESFLEDSSKSQFLKPESGM